MVFLKEAALKCRLRPNPSRSSRHTKWSLKPKPFQPLRFESLSLGDVAVHRIVIAPTAALLNIEAINPIEREEGGKRRAETMRRQFLAHESRLDQIALQNIKHRAIIQLLAHMLEPAAFLDMPK